MCTIFTISPNNICSSTANLAGLDSFYYQLVDKINSQILERLGVNLVTTYTITRLNNNTCEVSFCWEVPAGFSDFFVLASPLFLKCGQLFLFWLCLHLFYKLIPEIRG